MLLLRFARTTPVSGLQAGSVVVVQGRVVPRKLLKIANTPLDCVYHETVIEEWRRGVRGGRAMWTPAAGDEELEPFEVEDATGRVLVWPEPGQVTVRGGRNERGAGKRGGTRYVTRYIGVGDVVRVRGLVRVPPAPKKGKPRAPIEIAPPNGGKLVVLFRKRGAPPP
ncbi:MAG: hypothetical protein HYY06_28130 [Deltaproteobacteria bacterium]|nr:hypothetical protein [Deltaproteobacteria bacterium]